MGFKIVGESNADYHSNPAISHSKLKVWRKRPSLFKAKYIDGAIPDEGHSTDAFDMGTLAHTLILEGEEEFEKLVAISPYADFRSKAAKEWKKDAEEGGRLVVKEGALDSLFKMRDACLAHDELPGLLENGEAEVSWRFRPKGMPFEVQCRTDWFNGEAERPYVVDLKTTDSLDDGFQRSFMKYGYFRQAGFYTMLLRAAGFDPRWMFAVVEKRPPFEVRVFEPDEQAIDVGMRESLLTLNEIAAAMESGDWPVGGSGIEPISLSQWYEERVA